MSEGTQDEVLLQREARLAALERELLQAQADIEASMKRHEEQLKAAGILQPISSAERFARAQAELATIPRPTGDQVIEVYRKHGV